ncbi:MAG: ferrous iron transport protein B [Saprospiraceae bacterium]|nr:ferrous iron transport protein B [Saprospiraceae bacterium]
MSQTKPFTFALVGNPNAGKSSIFNQLTGLRQKVGNFPGVTVDKKIGIASLPDGSETVIVDLPGTYSLYPNSQDERIVLNILSNPKDNNYPNAIIYVADLTNLERHLLLFTQIKDLNIPLILCVGMIDVAAEQGVFLDKEKLTESLSTRVLSVNGRTGEGIKELKSEMLNLKTEQRPPQYKMFFQPNQVEIKTAEQLRLYLPEVENTYQAILWAHHFEHLPFLSNFQKVTIKQVIETYKFEDLRLQIVETLQRFDRLQPVLQNIFLKPVNEKISLTDRIDRIVTHAVAGPVIFFTVLFFIFQSVFALASFPMDGIEKLFLETNDILKANLPKGTFTDLLTDGILAGLSGVLVFIPQIAILFLLISLLEEVGYMARTVYMFDRIMQKVGLNGRSIVSLVSGGACAIPAIMSTRTISNWKERLITILVTPLISCSARLPVYALLVGFVVPDEMIGGIFNKQGLVFTGLYLLSIVSALGAAYVFKKIIKSNESTFLAIELPEYRLPHWKNIGFTVYEKVKSFVLEAGKIIMIVSIVLWFLASFSPIQGIEQTLEVETLKATTANNWSEQQAADYMASRKLETSYAGYLGKAIEPIIAPLGFDWKIGIALISSFAAREVFVGTMATIYSIGSAGEEDTMGIRERMKTEMRPNGMPMYSMSTALSLLIFYVFALQCMSTLAIVKRETKSWKWPIVQFMFMGFLAYAGSWLVFNLFN